ncbi:MAG TPA: VOC family protein [Casimicrobiaceae bacterium]|nr:VOC family protein [Casimicrobiaceae bacterium]
MNLNQVTLPALDVAESVAFYRRMGFELIVDSPHYARFACPQGGASFSVHRVSAVPEESAVVVYFEDEALEQVDGARRSEPAPAGPNDDRQAS